MFQRGTAVRRNNAQQEETASALWTKVWTVHQGQACITLLRVMRYLMTIPPLPMVPY